MVAQCFSAVVRMWSCTVERRREGMGGRGDTRDERWGKEAREEGECNMVA